MVINPLTTFFFHCARNSVAEDLKLNCFNPLFEMRQIRPFRWEGVRGNFRISALGCPKMSLFPTVNKRMSGKRDLSLPASSHCRRQKKRSYSLPASIACRRTVAESSRSVFGGNETHRQG